mgnify:CR=1 FL=1
MKNALVSMGILMSFISTNAWANGLNVFSSPNEQNGILSITYQNIAAIWGAKAEANYLRYLIHKQNGETQEAESSFDAYTYCLDNAAASWKLAEQYFDRILFSVPLIEDNETIEGKLSSLKPFD